MAIKMNIFPNIPIEDISINKNIYDSFSIGIFFREKDIMNKVKFIFIFRTFLSKMFLLIKNIYGSLEFILRKRYHE